jgi:hypothetical protein
VQRQDDGEEAEEEDDGAEDHQLGTIRSGNPGVKPGGTASGVPLPAAAPRHRLAVNSLRHAIATMNNASVDSVGAKRISELFSWALTLLVLSYLVVLSVFPVDSNDVFLYLEIGRRFFSGDGVPTTDIFRFAGATAAFDCSHELGSMLAYYLAYVVGGFGAVILTKSALVLAMGVIPFWVAWKLDRRRRSILLPVLLFFASYGASIRFIERGSLFSDVFSTLVVGLIIVIRARAGNVARYRAAIPAVFFVWVNVHAGFILGFMILLLWLLAELAKYLLSDEEDRPFVKTEIASIVKIIAGSLVLGLVNPRGWQAYLFMAKVAFGPDWAIVRTSNPEFMSPFASGFIEFLDIRVFIGVMLFCVLLAGHAALRQISRKAYRDLPLFEVLVLSVFTYVGFSMVRFIITATFGSAVIAAALLANNKPRLLGEADQTRPSLLVFPAVAILGVAGCLFAAAAHGYGPPERKRRIGFGVSMDGKPVQACEFIDNINLNVNIFNSYDYGNYMIWKWQGRRKVFVHGFVGDVDFLVHDYAGINRSAQDFNRIVSAYKIGAFLVHAPGRSQDSSSLPGYYRRLMTDREWHRVYSDEVSMLFVKEIPETRELFKRYSARHAGMSR